MRKDMLLLAEKCFTDALDCANSKEGELWLHFYMLGKTAEQLGKSSELFLDYYQKVCKKASELRLFCILQTYETNLFLVEFCFSHC